MKIKVEKRRGSILTLVIILIILIGITLGSYLNLVSNQNRAIIRSQQWNAAIPLAEAGIEEALAHLNRNVSNRGADGWKAEGTNVVLERIVGKDKYRVMINKDVDPPLIVSEGYVWVPTLGKFMDNPRRIRVSTTNDGLFSKAMVAKGNIDLSGNNVATDSFDSTDGKYSTGGQYDKAKNKAGGDVATNSSLTNSLNIGNADIWGRVATGPDGLLSIGKGSVGDKAWHILGKTGIKPGWSTDDMNVQFPDIQPPFTGGFKADSGVVSGTNYVYVLTDGKYEMDSLTLSGNEAIAVTGNAQLFVKGDVNMSGSAYIYVDNKASLQLYVAGANADLGGNGVVNPNGNAANFGYWGLNSNKQVKMSGNGAFIGTIYAPYADLVLGGGGSDIHDFIGASVSGTVKMNGHFRFHYDEALAKNGPRRGYTITSWSERGWTEDDGQQAKVY